MGRSKLRALVVAAVEDPRVEWSQRQGTFHCQLRNGVRIGVVGLSGTTHVYKGDDYLGSFSASDDTTRAALTRCLAPRPTDVPEVIEAALSELTPQEKTMGFPEYQALAMRTRRNDLPELLDQAAMGLGLAGEAGEVADHIKKVVGHGHPVDLDYLKKEVGDTLWYCAGVCEVYGLTLQQCAEGNIKKLEDRSPPPFLRNSIHFQR